LNILLIFVGDGDDHMSNNHWISPMDLHEKFEMHVPDRILVVGKLIKLNYYVLSYADRR
jgi:hypothetical protein